MFVHVYLQHVSVIRFLRNLLQKVDNHSVLSPNTQFFNPLTISIKDTFSINYLNFYIHISDATFVNLVSVIRFLFQKVDNHSVLSSNIQFFNPLTISIKDTSSINYLNFYIHFYIGCYFCKFRNSTLDLEIKK